MDHKTIITTRTATARLEGHLIKVVTHAGAEVNLEDAKEHIEAGRELAAGLEYTLLLVDVSQIRSITRDARVYYANPSGTQDFENRAVAILVDSPLSKVVANFFIGLNRPVTPVKLFTAESEALAWLAEFEG
jgi:hypothetical protein